jgi:PAS domain S-box-containing protein
MKHIEPSDISNDNGLLLKHDTVERLFPFFFAFDENLRFTKLGPSFVKISGASVGDNMKSWLNIIRPQIDLASLPALIDDSPRVVVLGLSHKVQARFKGEIQTVENGKYIFLGNLWIDSLDRIEEEGLEIADFSPNDPTIDYLHLIRSHEIASKDFRDLLAQLRSQREELILHSLIAEESDSSIVITDASGRIEWVNRSFEKYTGYTLEEVRQQKPGIVLQGEDTDRNTSAYMSEQIKQFKSFECEVLNYRKDGATYWTHVFGQPVMDAEGRPWKFFAIQRDITEERKNKAEKQVLEERLNIAIAASGAGIWEISRADDAIQCSSRFLENLRFPPETKLTISSLIDRIHPLDMKGYIEMAQRFKVGQELFFNGDIRLLCGDNQYRSFLVRATRVKQKDSDSDRLVGVILDIDSIKQLEYNLKIQTSRYNHLLSNILSGVLMEDESRRIVMVNKMFCDMFGIRNSLSELIGVDCSMSAEYSKHMFKDPGGFVVGIQKVLEDRLMVLNEELELADGRFFERDYIPLMQDGMHIGHLWQYRDISERKYAERELKLKEEKYRNIIENMNLGLMEVDNEGNILFVNQSFTKMSGFEVHELIGKNTMELFLGDASPNFMRKKQLERIAGKSSSYEMEVFDKYQHKRWWFISGAPFYDNTQKVVGSIGIHMDVTGQKLLENGLRNAKQLAEENARAKEIFLANMSHELRTPVNGIIGVARLLRNSEVNETQAHYLELLESTTMHLSKVLGDVLDLSRAGATNATVEHVRFDLNQSLNEVVRMLSMGVKNENVEVVIDTSLVADFNLISDVVKIKQILFNLIGNAIKFTAQGTVKVNVRCEISTEDRADLFVDVIDSGIGMSNEFLKVAFTKFSQEDTGLGRKFGGTGLGLSITRSLVDRLSGTISIMSRKGVGTTVSVYIPVLRQMSGLSDGQGQELRPINLNRVRVLVAEDNELNSMVIKLQLEAKGCDVMAAFSGHEVIEKLVARDFDIVLMDLHMPGMDGYHTAQTIRNEMRMAIPILALTADVRKGEEQKCMEYGMNGFMLKPYDEEQLYRAIDTLAMRSNNEASTKVKREPIQLGMLERSSQGNVVFIKKMLEIFIRESSYAITRLEEATENKNQMEVREIAHRLKMSVSNLGLNLAKDCCERIEEKVDQGKLYGDLVSEVAELNERLNQAIADVKLEIEKLGTA